MKKLFFVTMMLHFVILSNGQFAQKPYDDSPIVAHSEVQNFKIEFEAKGKLDNYGKFWRTELIRNLFNGSQDFADFKVFWIAPNSEDLKFVAHGKVRTHFRFSTTLKEPGFYYCVFTMNGIKKMIYIDAQTLDLKILLATQTTKTT